MSSALENGLFALGQVLRFPVFVLLWVCVIAALFMAGSCLVEFVTRQREWRGFDVKTWLQAGPVLRAESVRTAKLPAPLRQLVEAVERSLSDETLHDGGLEHLLLECEGKVRATLTAPRMLVKVGPSIGLIGTLIPMGISLASMASGDLESMAGQMVVAFTSTIIGLSTGTVAFVVATVRHGWVNQIVRDQRYLAERIAGELEPIGTEKPLGEYVREG